MSHTDVRIVGHKDVKLYLNRVKDGLIRHDLLEELGHFVDVLVEKRTLEGDAADGQSMGDYSPWAAKSRSAKGLQTDHIDLFFSGSMFGALTHKTDNDSVTTYFLPTKDSEGMSNPEKAAHLDSRFDFFGLNKTDVDKVMKEIDRHIDKVTRHGK